VFQVSNNPQKSTKQFYSWPILNLTWGCTKHEPDPLYRILPRLHLVTGRGRKHRICWKEQGRLLESVQAGMTFLSASAGGGPRRTSTPAPEIISRSSSRPLTRSTPTSKITRELGLVLAKSSTSISTMPRGNKNLSYMHEHQQIRVEFIKQSSHRQESSERNQKKK
jgi:hypothetical protein